MKDGLMIQAACADLQATQKQTEYTLLNASLSLNASLYAPCRIQIEMDLQSKPDATFKETLSDYRQLSKSVQKQAFSPWASLC